MSCQNERFSGDSTHESRSLRDRTFKIQGMDIASVMLEGEGRPVVLLHGNSSTKAVWTSQLSLLQEHGRPALALDLPGHGNSQNSPTPAETYSFPGYAGIVRDLLDHLNWNEVDIVGWSLGGHIGLELLATEDRVRSLLIVGTPPVHLCEQALHAAFYATDTMQLAGKDDFSNEDAITYGVAMMGGREHLPDHLLRNILRTDRNARKWMLANALEGIGADEVELVERTRKPLCVVHGIEEPFVRLDYLESLKFNGLWGNKIHTIEGAGHAPHWQTPAKFNSIFLEFLGIC